MAFETIAELCRQAAEAAAFVIEGFAALVLIIGAARFIGAIAPALIGRGDGAHGFTRARVMLGGHILAALEFLIVADILFTIIRRSLDELYILALLTAIRTALSWFLTREIETLKRIPPADDKG
ncbi:MAG: DUF1622 domain-containing protein [Parvularculaceae bacterium]